MKRKILTNILFVFLLCLTQKVDAMQPHEISLRTDKCESPLIELSEAKEDGSLFKVGCYQTYDEAKQVMNTTENNNLVIIENDIIIDAKYAVIDYDISYPSGHNGYIDIYTSNTSNTKNGYIRGGSSDDAAMIDYDYNTKRVRIKLAGIDGWINSYDGSLKLYDIVPISWVKTFQYYEVTNEKLIHYFPGNVYGTKGTSALTIDKKPEMLNVGSYYSYDGNYFYTSVLALLQDYKNGNYNQAINKDNPYYNYYQYVSFRTRTNYTLENINQYISMRTTDSESKMLNTGEAFINAQDTYGVNAAMMMAIGMNESGRGTSTIAKTKNNLFGLNAIDADPTQAANYFATVTDCINDYAYAWLAYGYLDPRDWRYYGANLGNKYQGLNYKYASDPFWSEKAAHYYYDLDSTFGFQDRDSYQVAVLNNNYSNTVYAKKTAGGENVSSYQYKLKGSSIVILEEVEGPEVNGNKIWYKIQADAMLDSNLNIYGESTTKPRVIYDWNNNMVYVSASYFNKVNVGTGNIPAYTPTPTPEPTPVTPSETPSAKAISAIVQEASYKYEGGNISGIQPNTSIETIKNNLTNTGGVITITDINGNTKDSGLIGTGDKVNITSGTTETLNVLIYGDTNGDGKISAVDYVNVKNHIMSTGILTGNYVSAADVNGDSNITAVDYVNIKNYIMGTDNVIKN